MMLNQQNRKLQIRYYTPDEITQSIHLFMIQTSGRLIKQKQLWRRRKTTCQFDPLLEAERKIFDPYVEMILQSDKVG